MHCYGGLWKQQDAGTTGKDGRHELARRGVAAGGDER